MGCGEDRLGFIMFECGLEGIKLKVVKRSQFEKNENGDNNKKNETEILCTDSIKSQEELDNNIAGKRAMVPIILIQNYYSFILFTLPLLFQRLQQLPQRRKQRRQAYPPALR